ncbi:MAG: NUDIX domain-containing protein [Candidatus Nanohalobium sp.]
MDKETRIKLVVERESGEFLLRDGGFPEAGIEDMLQRFQAAGRVTSELGLNPNSFQDMVRLQIVDEDATEFFVIHVKDKQPEIKGEGLEWLSEREILAQDFSEEDSYLIVPVLYSEEYLAEERNYHDNVTEIEVSKPLIKNEEGKFLAVKKSHAQKISSGEKFKKYGRMAGKWELPGGRIGKVDGENRFEAAKREIKEEIGIELKGERKDVMREDVEENNNVKAYILLYDDWEGEIDLSEEHNAYRWVTPAEYLNLNWHQDAGYGYPPMKFLKEYLGKDKTY